MPWDGYWLFNTGSTDVALKIPPVEFFGASRPVLARLQDSAPFQSPAGPDAWAIQITARTGNLVDADNYLGVSSSSSVTWDALDFLDPPPLEHYVTVYFPHDDEPVETRRYAGDFRYPTSDGQSWTFTLETDVQVGSVTLSFDGMDAISPTSRIMLFDTETGQEANLRQVSTHTVYLNAHERLRRFKVAVGPDAYMAHLRTSLIPQTFVLSQNYPNPFNPATTIRFGLPQPTAVTLTIYNVLGQHVRTLIKAELLAGFHTVQWDGRSESGHPVSSGVYVYRLQAGTFIATHKLTLVR